MSTRRRFGNAIWVTVLLGVVLAAGPAFGQFQADYRTDRYRAVVGQEVKFYDFSDTEDIIQWEWLFGDGTGTGPLLVGDDQVHAYTALGTYSPALTIRNAGGASSTEVKSNLIEIMNPPFADFIFGNGDFAERVFGVTLPAEPPEGATFFLDRSVGPIDTGDYDGDGNTTENIPAVKWDWQFGDGQFGSGALAVHLYVPAVGVYTVKLTVTFADGSSKEISRDILLGEGGGPGGIIENRQAAKFILRDSIMERDGHGLVPLIDWVPVFSFEMISAKPEGAKSLDGAKASGAEDPRTMYDPVNDRTIDWDIPLRFYFRDPDFKWVLETDDILEFAIFREKPQTAGGTNGVLEDDEQIVLRWLPDGRQVDVYAGVPYDPREEPIYPTRRPIYLDPNPFPGLKFVGETSEGLCYELYGQVSDRNPVTGLIQAQEFISDLYGDDSGQSWIVCMRTTATWRKGLQFNWRVDSVTMVDGFGFIPLDDNGEMIDEYEPALEDYPVETEAKYVSQFDVWDASGGLFDDFKPPYINGWTWPNRLYTPTPEYVRPRWDAPSVGPVEDAFDIVTGEWLDLRKLFAIDHWAQLVGINVHSTQPPEMSAPWSRNGRHEPYAEDPGTDEAGLCEVNIIITDVNADPFDPQGVNSLNPVEELERMTTDHDGHSWAYINTAMAVGSDFTFNGMWVFADTNQNGCFDPPIPASSDPNGLGVTFIDFPMMPAGQMIAKEEEEKGAKNAGIKPLFAPSSDNPNVNPYDPQWEYIQFPPNGGAPWWKLRIALSGNSREGGGKGFIEPKPDWYSPATDDPDTGQHLYPTPRKPDYFVVMRADGGYMDISGVPGDGVGMTLGTDLKVFIEPRRFNDLVIDPASEYAGGSWDGGIYLDSMQMPQGDRDDSPSDRFAYDIWQNDPLWLDHEPWWPDRTTNRHATKEVRGGVDVNDLTLTYEGNSKYATYSDIDYLEAPDWIEIEAELYSFPTLHTSRFDRWLDVTGATQALFYWYDSVDVMHWFVESMGLPNEDIITGAQHAFETVPFFQPDFDARPIGPRSHLFPNPPAQPERPDYSTWPGALEPDAYPEIVNWPLENRRARILRQHIDSDSQSVAVLGMNLNGAKDPFVNRYNQLHLQQVTVAIWGPDFTPEDLLDLDIDGTEQDSGVLLYEDANRDGVFSLFDYFPLAAATFGSDTALPLRDLSWRPAPEPVDLDGDGNADDVDGDGDVDQKDYAWVLRLRLKEAWPVPIEDKGETIITSRVVLGSGGEDDDDEGDGGGGAAGGKKSPAGSVVPAADGADATPGEVVEGDEHWAKRPQRIHASEELAKAAERIDATKNIGPKGNSGDDVFVVLRTSDKISRLEEFKTFIPATLPSRPAYDRQAGIQFTPANVVSPQAYVKRHPEESPVQPWYRHEMMRANVPCEVVDLTGSGQSIFLDGSTVPVLGLDMATNRPDLVVGEGSNNGIGGPASFIVPGATWADGEFVGYTLVASDYQPFDIVGNTSDRLTLESGTPPDGSWRIVKNPTFFEQLIVELYDEGRDGEFTIQSDLQPLDIDQTISGLALYRDNDEHPDNRNGEFDPDVDIPVELDYPPYLIGAPGEPDTQVLFVFSTPGTDDLPRPRTSQARHRQWVPATFGETGDDDSFGPDFFVVIRATNRIGLGDDFRAAVVSWGPSTPTEPDPDTFPPPPLADRGEFDIFSEFPWGSRALGFITVFSDVDLPDSDMPTSGIPDNSGFNFIRTTASKAVRTSTITAEERVIGPTDVVISTASPTSLPINVPVNGLKLIITGKNFGKSPTVTLAGLSLTPTSVSDTLIQTTIPGGTTISQDPVVLTVVNTVTGKQMTRSDLFTLISGGTGNAPEITSVTPECGGPSDFPVVIFGSDFDSPEVFFDKTSMPVLSWSPTRIDVAYPDPGGIGKTGLLDVTVRNAKSKLSTVALAAFEFKNPPLTPQVCFIATAAYGGGLDPQLATLRDFRDAVLLKTAAGAAFVDFYYKASPPLADAVAERPWLRALVRMGLTPTAWMIKHPMQLGMMLVLSLAGLTAWRRRATQR